MKKYSLLFIAAALVFTGCSAPDDAAAPPKRKMIAFDASAGYGNTYADTQSRAIYDGTTTKWEADDEIAFYAKSYGTDYAQVTLSVNSLSENSGVAVFQGMIPEPVYPDTFYAAYPAARATINQTGTTFTIPDTQTGEAIPMMVAEAETAGPDCTFNFRVVNALLRVNLPEGITSVTFSGCAGEELAGDFIPVGPTGITIPNPGTECYFVLPAMTLSNGYMLTLRQGNDMMIRSYSRNVFAQATCYTATISDFIPIGVTIAPSAQTSYSIWQSGDVATANMWRGDLARFSGSFEGISNRLVTECGVTIGSTDYPGTLDNPAGAKTFTADVVGLQRKTTTAIAYIKVGGVKYTSAASAEAVITGLPYTAEPPTDADWSSGSWNTDLTSDYAQIGGVMGSGEASITSSDFYIPAPIDITIETNCRVIAKNILGWRNTTFTVRVNGVNVISQYSNSTDQHYDLSGNGQFTPSAKTIKCESSYTLAGPLVQIFSLTAKYN